MIWGKRKGRWEFAVHRHQVWHGMLDFAVVKFSSLTHGDSVERDCSSDMNDLVFYSRDSRGHAMLAGSAPGCMVASRAVGAMTREIHPVRIESVWTCECW